MILPRDASTVMHQSPIATFWFDNEGIMNSISKNVSRTTENLNKHAEILKALGKNDRICCIADVSNSGVIDKVSRDYLREEMSRIYKAVAVLTTSSFGKIIATLLVYITNSSIPIKIFTDEQEARKWLRETCSQA